jgi:hypothetical protein
LEVGSGNVNGSVRPYLERLDPARYVGVDAAPGDGVDLVGDCAELTDFITDQFDVVISTEMLEHVRDWRACVYEMAKVCAPGGLIVWTTRSPGFPYHGYPEDHWRYTLSDMQEILSALYLRPLTVADDPDAPGVFAVAQKPSGEWVWWPEALAQIKPEKVTRFPQQSQPNDEPQLVVAFPLYGQVSAQWFMNWLGMDYRHVASVAAVEGSMYLPQKMEMLVAKSFELCPDLDRIVVLEQDMIPPLDAFERIAAYGDEYDIVGSTYFKHEPPHHVMAWMQVDAPRFSPLTRTAVKQMVDSPGLYKVDGVAMGLTSIHRRVFEKWDPSVPMWQPTPPMVGHDLHFCHEANKQGFGVYLDSGLGCGHLTTIPIGYHDSQQALAEDEPETWADALARNATPSPETVM